VHGNRIELAQIHSHHDRNHHGHNHHGHCLFHPLQTTIYDDLFVQVIQPSDNLFHRRICKTPPPPITLHSILCHDNMLFHFLHSYSVTSGGQFETKFERIIEIMT
jgi:hypothetical protein